MKFLDYEKIVRDNYPILIESYVKQYGEEYRGRIVSVLERLKYCFFVTPNDIINYIDTKKKEDYFKAILDSFEELGINTDGVSIGEQTLEFSDPSGEKLISVLFPDLDKSDTLITTGIFSFDSKYDSLDWDDPIIAERLILLEKLNKKRTDILDRDYVLTDEYVENCLVMGRYLKVFKRNFSKWVESYDELYEYAMHLDNKILEIGRNYEKEYMISLKDYLSERDKRLIDSGEEFDVVDLEGYSLYFDSNLLKENYLFTEGPIEYFNSEYTDDLLDENIDKKEKEKIIKMRLKYLKKIGVSIKGVDFDLLCCDWYDLDFLKKYLPTKEFLEKIDELKQLYFSRFEYEVAKLCVINDYELVEDCGEIGTIFDDEGHSCSLYRPGEITDPNSFFSVLCLNPLTSQYNLFDIAVDHEIRHAIEMRMKFKSDKIILKIGCDFSSFDLNFENPRESFTDTNERLTQKLSIEATQERWKKGQFIFSDKYALKTAYPCCIYDYDLDNLDIIFVPFRKEIVKAQISPLFPKIFSVIPRCEMKEIDSLITNHSRHAIRKLKVIRRRLMKRKLEKKHNKSNKKKTLVKVKIIDKK